MSNEPDKVNSGVLATTMALVALATLAIALYVTSLVRDEVDSTEAKRSLSQDTRVRQLTAEQVGELNEPPRWVDKAKGLVSVPIERAMKWTLDALRADPYAITPGAKGYGGAGGASASELAAQSAGDDEDATPDGPSEQEPSTDAPKAPKQPAPEPGPSGQQGPAPTSGPEPTGPQPKVDAAPAPSPAPAPAPENEQ